MFSCFPLTEAVAQGLIHVTKFVAGGSFPEKLLALDMNLAVCELGGEEKPGEMHTFLLRLLRRSEKAVVILAGDPLHVRETKSAIQNALPGLTLQVIDITLHAPVIDPVQLYDVNLMSILSRAPLKSKVCLREGEGR